MPTQPRRIDPPDRMSAEDRKVWRSLREPTRRLDVGAVDEARADLERRRGQALRAVPDLDADELDTGVRS